MSKPREFWLRGDEVWDFKPQYLDVIHVREVTPAEEAKDLLEQISHTCLCTRNTPGFDYSEEHKRLGKPKIGARWLTPRDLIKEWLKKYGEPEGNDRG